MDETKLWENVVTMAGEVPVEMIVAHLRKQFPMGTEEPLKNLIERIEFNAKCLDQGTEDMGGDEPGMDELDRLRAAALRSVVALMREGDAR